MYNNLRKNKILMSYLYEQIILSKEQLHNMNNGTTDIDNLFISSISPFSELLFVAIFSLLFKYFPNIRNLYSSKNIVVQVFLYFLDLFLIIFPLFIHTILSIGNEILYGIGILCLTYIILLIAQGKTTPNIFSENNIKKIESNNTREYMGIYKHYHALILIRKN